jgi:hypothetical protein
MVRGRTANDRSSVSALDSCTRINPRTEGGYDHGIQPRPSLAWVIGIGYALLFLGLEAVMGVGYDQIEATTDYIIRGIVIPVAVASLVPVILTTALGWWRPVPTFALAYLLRGSLSGAARRLALAVARALACAVALAAAAALLWRGLQGFAGAGSWRSWPSCS